MIVETVHPHSSLDGCERVIVQTTAAILDKRIAATGNRQIALALGQ